MIVYINYKSQSKYKKKILQIMYYYYYYRNFQKHCQISKYYKVYYIINKTNYILELLTTEIYRNL